jgi:hypothetical protein
VEVEAVEDLLVLDLEEVEQVVIEHLSLEEQN